MPRSGALARIMASTSMPVCPGMDRSISSTSISVLRTRSMASRPLAASPTTRRSTWSEKNCRRPERTMAWSSTMPTLIIWLLPVKRVVAVEGVVLWPLWSVCRTAAKSGCAGGAQWKSGDGAGTLDCRSVWCGHWPHRRRSDCRPRPWQPQDIGLQSVGPDVSFVVFACGALNWRVLAGRSRDRRGRCSRVWRGGRAVRAGRRRPRPRL